MATLLGAYVGVPDNTNGSAQDAVTRKYNSFVSAMGQPAGTLDTYVNGGLPWSQWDNDAQFSANSFRATSWAQNVIPTIALPMSAGGEDADQSFKNIINGSEDSVINGVFQAWASAGYTQQYLRPGWEMNGFWMPWSVNSGNAADYVAAFQHIAGLAHSFGGANIQVVWNPNVGNHSAVPISTIYPGNSAVDVIGLDTYGEPLNVDNSPDDSSTAANNFSLKQALDMAKANGKSFALPETGGLTTAFPNNLASVIAQSGVQVAFVNIWDTSDANGDLTWSNNPDVSAAWRAAFQTISGGGGAAAAPAAAVPAAAAPTVTNAPAGNATANTLTDASLTTAPTTGGFSSVAIIASGALDQSGVSQAVGNGVNTITPDNPVWGEYVQLGGSAVNLSFINSGNLTVAGNVGTATIAAASGTNTFLVGSGTLDITGGSGPSNYVFTAKSGALKIEDFSLQKGNVLSVAQGLQGAYNAAGDGNGGSLLTFGTGGSIDLVKQAAPSAAQINWV